MNIPPCPPHGAGVHAWPLSAANKLRPKNVTPENAAAWLRDQTANQSRESLDLTASGLSVKYFGAAAGKTVTWEVRLAWRPEPRCARVAQR